MDRQSHKMGTNTELLKDWRLVVGLNNQGMLGADEPTPGEGNKNRAQSVRDKLTHHGWRTNTGRSSCRRTSVEAGNQI